MTTRSAPIRAIALDEGVDSLVITEVRVRLHHRGTEDILRAFASITLNNHFAVHNLKVIDKGDGPFVSMPARRNRDAYSDIAHPIDRTFREYMEDKVLTEYERELARNA